MCYVFVEGEKVDEEAKKRVGKSCQFLVNGAVRLRAYQEVRYAGVQYTELHRYVEVVGLSDASKYIDKAMCFRYYGSHTHLLRRRSHIERWWIHSCSCVVLAEKALTYRALLSERCP